MKGIMYANEQGQGQAITIEREGVYERTRVGGEGSEDEDIIKSMREWKEKERWYWMREQGTLW